MEDLAARALAGLMIGSGAGRTVVPGYFRGLVPPWVPAPSAAVAVSGAADVLAGVLLTRPATRRAGAWLAAALVTAYLPAHLDPLRRASTATRLFDRRPGIAARLLVNVSYIGWAVAVARGAEGRSRGRGAPRSAPRG
ncbi:MULTISPECIES: DoxX family protein [unclassified Blastococcus]